MSKISEILGALVFINQTLVYAVFTVWYYDNIMKVFNESFAVFVLAFLGVILNYLLSSFAVLYVFFGYDEEAERNGL